MTGTADREQAAGPSPEGFVYRGELSWRDFARLAQDVRRFLDAQAVRGKLRRRAFSAFVEMTYNVLNHAAPVAGESPGGSRTRRVSAEITLEVDGRTVCVTTCNLIEAAAVAALAARLAELGASGGQGQVHDLRPSAARPGGGQRPDDDAGLGLLTIAREASRPLEHHFSPAAPRDRALRLFTLRACV